MDLADAERAFILHWGEMGSRWGVNRSVAQVHALLYLAARPMAADEIAETLSIARSNVSTSIRELLSWRLIETVSELGDRREHFVAVADALEMAKRIVEGRRQREFLPTLESLERLASEAEASERPRTAERMRETLTLMRELDRWYRDMRSLPNGTQRALLKMGAQVARFLPKGAGRD